MVHTVRIAEIDGAPLRQVLPFTTYTSTSGEEHPEVVVQEYSFGAPNAREVTVNAALRNGTYDYTTLFGSRTVTMSFKIFGPNRFNVASELAALAIPSRRLYVYVQQPGWDQERRMMIRGVPSAPAYGLRTHTFLEMTLTWNAPTGVFETAEPLMPDPLYPEGAAPPLTLPFVLSDTLTPGGDTGRSINITHPGTVPSGPILRVHGSCRNPKIYNLTTGKRFALLNTTIPAEHSLYINTQARTVYMDADPALSYYGNIDWNTSDWWDMIPGLNKISMTALSPSAGAHLEVIYYPAWI